MNDAVNNHYQEMRDQRAEDVKLVQELKQKGYSNVAIARLMGLNETNVRILLNIGEQE